MSRGYAHVARSGIFRVAVERERLVSLACAIVRDDVWFLSGFWTHPSAQRVGIGGPLLREVWDEGKARGARKFYVWASIDLTAIASYMKLGMLPGTQLFAFAGTPRSAAHPPLATEPLVPEVAADLDRVLVGVRRDGDHRYWLERDGVRARVVRDRGTVAGYYYVHDGTVGPVGWVRDDLGEAVLSLAVADAASDGKDVQLTVPGSNHTAIRLAFSSGLRLIRTSHLLWTEPIGAVERYVPSGPLLF